jgi:LysR family transcriptional regulator (chromosome initiation inhibitor)
VDTTHLATLLAIVDHGTFEAAARALHLTPSAVSQRIRALESEVGQVVLRRSVPCRPTAAGEVLIRLARQHELLLTEARVAIAGRGLVTLPLAVNADSLATWLRPVLAEVAGWDAVSLRLHVEDQAYSADLLRSGDVLGAVTSDSTPVQGCRVNRLGAMRYRPAAAPGFADRWRKGRGHDWQGMPVVTFNDKDALQGIVLQERGASPSVVHRVPTSHDFLEAVRVGLGWGMVPEQQLDADLAQGRLALLSGGHYVDIPLHWMRWRLDSPLLDRVGLALSSAAAGLRR